MPQQGDTAVRDYIAALYEQKPSISDSEVARAVADYKRARNVTAPSETSAYTGKTPAQAANEPLKIAGIPAKYLAAGAGSLIAGPLASEAVGALGSIAGSSIPAGLLRYFGPSIAGSVAAGSTSRAISAEPGQRGQAAIPTIGDIGIGAAFPAAIGALGFGKQMLAGAAGATTKEAETASRLGKILPRIVRRGVTEEVGKAANVAVQDPKALLGDVNAVVQAADAKRFPPLFAKYPNAITNASVVDQWDAIRRNIPSAIEDMLAEKDIAREPLTDLVQQVGKVEVPTLEGIQKLKESLDASIQSAKMGASVTKDAKSAAGRGLRSLVKARQQLTNLTFTNVPGGSEYRQALSESAADRQALTAVRKGTKMVQAPSNPLNQEPVTTADVAKLKSQFALTPAEPAYKAGAVGALGQTADPLGRLGNPAVQEKFATLLGEPAMRGLETNLAPWEKAAGLAKQLQEPIGAQGVAGQFGAATAVAGGSPRTLIGSLTMDVLPRKAALAQAKKLAPFFLGNQMTDADTREFLSIIQKLNQQQRTQARIGGLLSGAASAGFGSGLLGRP